MKYIKFNNKYVCIVLCTALLSSVLFYAVYSNRHSDRVAVKAIKYLYEFSTPEEKVQNLKKLSKLCTSKVYDELTYSNQEVPTPYELVMAYKDPCKVNILYKGNGYIIYSLNTGTVKSSTQFIFAYQSFMGHIVSVNNGEFNDFFDDYSDNR